MSEGLFVAGSKFVFWSDQNLALRGNNIPPVSLTIKMKTYMKTIKNRNVNGRPTKKPSEKKAYKITVKMATEEYYSLKAKARLAGINRSEFIRQCICSSVVKQRLTPELMGHIRQLSGMANNVNQIARTANAAGYNEVHNHCLIMSDRLDKVIKRIEDDC